MKNLITLGSVSHATLLTKDLIPRFMEALDDIRERIAAPGPSTEPPEETQQRVQMVSALDDFLGGIERRLHRKGYFDSLSEAEDDCQAIQDRLNEFCPPFIYFGPSEGNSSDFGFWVNWDSINEALADGSLRKYPAGCHWPKLPKEVEYVLEVNDHANCTLYDRDHNELWSCV